ncbi:MAG TPA: hypothetical protein VIC25_10725 [Caulobacteraceae bacterium]|jgi:hypothetical protein
MSIQLAAAVAIFGAATLASTAFASGSQLTDSQYLAAAHCQGLFDAKTLGSADASGIDSLMRSEGAYRAPEIADRAAEARGQALKMASRASVGSRNDLIAQRDGACSVWAKASGGVSGGH